MQNKQNANTFDRLNGVVVLDWGCNGVLMGCVVVVVLGTYAKDVKTLIHSTKTMGRGGCIGVVMGL